MCDGDQDVLVLWQLASGGADMLSEAEREREARARARARRMTKRSALQSVDIFVVCF